MKWRETARIIHVSAGTGLEVCVRAFMSLCVFVRRLVTFTAKTLLFALP